MKLIKYLKDPNSLFLSLLLRYFKWLPDETYLKLRFRFEMRRKLILKEPKTFQEKLQWLKLKNRKTEFTGMVDKYSVKEYVSQRIGEDYVIPTIGVWDSVDEISFDDLPVKFVLKTTHGGGGGGVVVCTDKLSLNIDEAKARLQKSMDSDIYKGYREWPYKNVRRRIIAEKLIESKFDGEIFDYKFFCFNGEPKFFKVDFNRFISHRANYYDMDWNLLPFGEAVCPPDHNHINKKPLNFDMMIDLVRKLSSGHPFLRVDLYNVDGTVYFGELTFYPASGMGTFIPEEWNRKVGDMLDLPD